jgi:ATP-dependent exoDNAse (exonuclease V) beta subunit
VDRAQLRSLTPSQLEVLNAVEQGKRVIVKACAGSGKTTTLVMSYVSKLKEIEPSVKPGSPYDHLLAITFTNEAAVKLKRDIFRETDGDIRALTNRMISTIHSFCNYILRENIVEAGINPDYEIAEEYDIAEAGGRILDRIVGDNIVKDAELRQFIHKYGYYARARMGNSGFKGMIMAVYGWMRAEGFSIDEGLSALRNRRTAYEKWLNQRGREILQTQQYAGSLRSSTALIEKYLAIYWGSMEKEKKEGGRIGYDDIIYYAYRLLKESAHIGERYRKQLSYVFIDEFQDTDALQLEVINMVSARDRQFFVGDPQQLIYEWRNANPELFSIAERDALSEEEGTSVIYLKENFRSSAGIVSFVNHLFSRLMRGDKTEFVEMTAARDDLIDAEDNPSVCIFLPAGETQDERSESEASMIASEILKIIEGEMTVVDMHDRRRRKAKYSDIALLFRSRSAVRVYEDELATRHIPYLSLQNSTFFKRPEVRALMDYVMHLARPSDPFYTAAVMRSPIFDVDDNLIVSSASNGFDMQKMSSQTGDQGDSGLGKFIRLETWIAAVSGMRTSEILHEVLKQTSFGTLCLAGTRGKEAYANVIRFIDVIRAVESGGRMSAVEVAEELGRMEDSGSEPESLMHDESSNAVRLMTVHGAKGLEFPVVFIARAFSHPRKDNYDMFIDRNFGIIFREIDDGSNPLLEFYGDVESDLSEINGRGRDEEEKRIFYVAATRAQQRLYISAVDGSRGGSSWSSEVGRILKEEGISAGQAADGISELDGSLLRLIKSSLYGEKIVAEDRAGIRIDRSTFELDLTISRGKEQFTVSPTIIAEFMVCHHKTALSKSGPVPDEDDSHSVSSMGRGVMIHSFLEHYDYVNEREPEFLRSTFGNEYDDVASRSMQFVQSELGREARAAALNGKLFREMQFSSRYNRAILNGKLDMVISHGEKCIIVDYKSGKGQGHTGEYRDQLLFYASAVMKITGCSSVRLVNFFVDEKEQLKTFTVERAEVEQFDNLLADSLEAYDREDSEASPADEKCGSCAYRSSCAFRYGKVEDAAGQTG